MHSSLFPLIISMITLPDVYSQPKPDWAYACNSIICDPPKMCIVQDEVAQCLLVLAPTDATPSFFSVPAFATTPTPFQPKPLNPSPTNTNNVIPPALFGALTASSHSTGSPAQATPSTASPFAPLLSLFGSPPPALTLPTLSPPSTTTSKPRVDVCSLPPLTGSCSRARIMWYFDTETGKCERFSYSGCGNNNRFPSKLQCEQKCQRTGK